MPADPLIGRRLGNVRLISRLGHGSMGVVYRAYHERFNKDVAVKLLLQTNGEDKTSYRERFLREGRSAAKVHHEHVVQVLDAGQEEGIAYLVMELVNGQSLGAILDAAGALPAEVAARLGVGMALGLAAIHAKGIIHRDIKPDNILVGEDKKVKITDLGLAKQVDDPNLLRLTATGIVVGTPLYVSPEAIRDPKSITPEADIYSLGATLYHVLTGEPPFKGVSSYEVMRGHLEGKFRPIHEIKPEIPAGLAHVIEDCLNKSPDKRPTALQLADLLSQGVSLKVGANTGLAVFIGVVAVVVLGGGLAGWSALHASNEPAKAVEVEDAGVRITTNVAKFRVAVDDGPWMDGSKFIQLLPGKHVLQVESQTDGLLLTEKREITIASHQKQELVMELQPVTINQVRVDFPGAGMLFVDGDSYGRDAKVTFTQAGTHYLSRSDGRSWTNQAVTIDARGAVSKGAVTRGDRPLKQAYWKQDLPKIGPYHIVSWWLAEEARKRYQLPEPPGWSSFADKPEQAAINLTPALIESIRAMLNGMGAKLAGKETAVAYGISTHAAVWYDDNGKLATSGGKPATAAVLAVPSEP